MSYVEAVYFAGILGALCFFAAGYLFHASRIAASKERSARIPQRAYDEGRGD